MENLKDIYLELAEKINDAIPEIKHIDLWHNQVNFLEEEHSFQAPAVFLEFRATSTDDLSTKVQNLNMQVNVYLFFETFLDSDFKGYNKTAAVAFLDTLTKLHKLLHGSSGENWSEMRRIGFSPVDTGSAQNLYQMPYECLVSDISAKVEADDVVDDDNDGENEWQDYVIEQ